MPTMCRGAHNYSFSPESRMLAEIESHSRDFKKKLDRILFSEGYFKVDQREPLERLTLWIRENKYPRIDDFLNLLSHDDAQMLFELFKEEDPITSEVYSPAVPSSERMNSRRTILTFLSEVSVSSHRATAVGFRINPAQAANSHGISS